jgi:hypothetical protein
VADEWILRLRGKARDIDQCAALGLDNGMRCETCRSGHRKIWNVETPSYGSVVGVSLHPGICIVVTAAWHGYPIIKFVADVRDLSGSSDPLEEACRERGASCLIHPAALPLNFIVSLLYR